MGNTCCSQFLTEQKLMYSNVSLCVCQRNTVLMVFFQKSHSIFSAGRVLRPIPQKGYFSNSI